MRVQIKAFATLKDFEPEGSTLELPDGADVTSLLEALGVPAEEVKIVFVNGRHSKKDKQLAEGDLVSLFPAVGGG
jgi:sulfur carrier protein ThiS